MGDGVRLWLASASARRAEWIKAKLPENVVFEARPLLSEERVATIGAPVSAQVAQTLVEKVANARVELSLMARAIDEGVEGASQLPDIVVVADTLVEDPDDPLIPLGKPSDPNSALTTLLRLRGRRHIVWSGTALLSPSAENARVWHAQSWIEFATVEIEQIGDDELAELVTSESWRGKAGGYDLAGPMGGHATLISGDEVCVLGLAATATDVLFAMLEKPS